MEEGRALGRDRVGMVERARKERVEGKMEGREERGSVEEGDARGGGEGRTRVERATRGGERKGCVEMSDCVEA